MCGGGARFSFQSSQAQRVRLALGSRKAVFLRYSIVRIVRTIPLKSSFFYRSPPCQFRQQLADVRFAGGRHRKRNGFLSHYLGSVMQSHHPWRNISTGEGDGLGNASCTKGVLFNVLGSRARLGRSRPKIISSLVSLKAPKVSTCPGRAVCVWEGAICLSKQYGGTKRSWPVQRADAMPMLGVRTAQ